MNGTDVVLSARGVSVEYGGAQPVRAVRDVTLDLRRGEILGIAGESGCGKSTLAFALARLLRPPAELTGGTITFTEPDGTDVDLAGLDTDALRRFRWNRMSMVFQSAMNALNPVTTISRQIDDILLAHRPGMTKRERRSRAAELLDMVGIDPARLRGFPHELSGGMRQRVGIAMALCLQPDVVIMDEPTTALDVVVQREILDRIELLRADLGFAIIFITHDLALLMEISDRLAIMYAGRIVEQAPVRQIERDPRHPYTRALLRSFPDLDAERRDLRGVPGAPPDLRETPQGCPFQPRCAHAFAPCRTTLPLARQVDGAGEVACHLHDPAYPQPNLDEVTA
ncbi:MAG TPA: ABC transporter ATP-binding protein [Pseudonocardiaceae bacterium]|nr:ABC transporter ATP-binding protein [Pseudonocardiaceae bacterium]